MVKQTLLFVAAVLNHGLVSRLVFNTPHLWYFLTKISGRRKPNLNLDRLAGLAPIATSSHLLPVGFALPNCTQYSIGRNARMPQLARLAIKVRGWGPGWPGIVDKSEGLGAGLARALSIEVRGWGPGRLGPAQKYPLLTGL